MGTENKDSQRSEIRRRAHMPPNSIFFEKLVPVILVILGVICAGLILFAAGVLLGLIQF